MVTRGHSSAEFLKSEYSTVCCSFFVPGVINCLFAICISLFFMAHTPCNKLKCNYVW